MMGSAGMAGLGAGILGTPQINAKRGHFKGAKFPVFVMPGLVPGIHVFFAVLSSRHGWPGQARP
jgi:hypothetical protein